MMTYCKKSDKTINLFLVLSLFLIFNQVFILDFNETFIREDKERIIRLFGGNNIM